MTPALFILGPTATGKSEIAHRLALQSGAQIFCMDSMQIYKELHLGVGKPTLQEQQEVHYGGMNLVSFRESFDVAQYLKSAEEFIRDATLNTKPIIVVGGTGLYYRALTQGLSTVPEIDPSIREKLEQLPLEILQQDLHKEDPLIASKIDLQNPRRVIRALEVKKATGISLLEWQKKNSPPLIQNFKAFFIQRENLRERIKQRTLQMMDQGWLQEVIQLQEQFGAESIQKIPAIGYDLLLEVSQGTLSRSEAVEKIQIQTWQYARRQLTWFRKESNYSSLNLNANSNISSVIETISHSGWLHSCS